MTRPNAARARQSESHISREAARQALANLLPPLLELALRAGLKYADVDGLIRESLLRLAPQLAQSANTSHLSVLTGLHRKAVAQWREEQAAHGDAKRRDAGPNSHAAQVFTLWLHAAQKDARLRRLPMHAPYGEVAMRQAPLSFAALARQVSTDVHPRSLFEELLRLGLVSEAGAEVCLQREAFVPQGGAQDQRLALLAANTAAHLATGLNNCTAPDLQPWLEQAIWAEGVDLDAALQLEAQARELWEAAHRLLFTAIEALPEAQPGKDRYCVRVGMYAHAEALPTHQESP